MSVAALFVFGLVVAACVALAPGCTGLIQTAKARLQGRRGPSPLQPYRELRRLWGKSTVEPAGSTMLYRVAPALATAALGCGLVVATSALIPAAVPIATPLGGDFLLLFGLLALARFVMAISAWDTTNGFGLLGAARDLFIAISAEVVLLLALVLMALPAGSTDLGAMSAASTGWAVWQTPAHWCALLAFCVATVTETGRQPIDNPDTHLELTMIHEGPLLEYAGRDLAFLQWAASARHVIMLALLVGVFLPHGSSSALGIPVAVGWFVMALAGLAVTETLLAKMRLMRVPAFLGTSGIVVLIGLATWFWIPVP